MWAESTPNQGQARAKPGPSQGRIQSSHSSSVGTSRYMRCETCFLFIPLLAFLSAYTDIALSNLLGTVSTHTLTPTHTHTHTQKRTHVHTHPYTHTLSHTHAHTRAHTHAPTHTHRHTHITKCFFHLM